MLFKIISEFYSLLIANKQTDDVICFISDINECAIGTPCGANAICTDTFGSFSCQCNQGFTGDGVTCNSKQNIQSSTLC